MHIDAACGLQVLQTDYKSASCARARTAKARTNRTQQFQRRPHLIICIFVSGVFCRAGGGRCGAGTAIIAKPTGNMKANLMHFKIHGFRTACHDTRQRYKVLCGLSGASKGPRRDHSRAKSFSSSSCTRLRRIAVYGYIVKIRLKRLQNFGKYTAICRIFSMYCHVPAKSCRDCVRRLLLYSKSSLGVVSPTFSNCSKPVIIFVTVPKAH